MNNKILENTEFNYTPKEMEKIQELRKMIENFSNLIVGVEDVFFSKYLNYTKWDVPKAFAAIRHYYNFKLENPEWIMRHNVEYFREQFLDVQSKIVMPRPDKDGRAIVIFKTVHSFDANDNFFSDAVEMQDLIFESLFILPQVQKFGLTIIYDITGISCSFLRMLSPKYARLLNAKVETLPITQQRIHVIYKSFLIKAMFALIMSFMAKETKEMITLHDGKNLNKLRTMIGAENLPEEYGGPAGVKCDANIIYDHLLRHAEYLEQIQSYRKCV